MNWQQLVLIYCETLTWVLKKHIYSKELFVYFKRFTKSPACYLNLHYLADMAESTSGRFRPPKTAEEEEICCEQAVQKSTRYKNKWTASIFEEWQRVRTVKVPVIEVSGLYKGYDLHKVQPLEVTLPEMDTFSLNYWLAKFVQEALYIM